MRIHLISSITQTEGNSGDDETVKKSIIMPLGIATLSAFLKQNGLDVVQTDMNAEFLFDGLVNKQRKIKNLAILTEHENILNDIYPYGYDLSESPIYANPEKYGIQVDKDSPFLLQWNLNDGVRFQPGKDL